MKVSYKQLILLGFILIFLEVGAFFTVNVPLPRESHIFSAIGMVSLALPSFAATVKWLGWRGGIILISTLGVYALVIETAAIVTGFPYGHFGYSVHLGYKLFGYTPWTVIFGWTPLVLASGAVAYRLSEKIWLRVPIIILLLLFFDLVLDPGAVLLGFWKYPAGGAFYGVPISNFAGWLFSGLLGAFLFAALVHYFKPLLPAPAQLVQSAWLILFFWTGIAVFGGLLVPAVVGAAVLIGLAAFYARYHCSGDELIVLVDENNGVLGTAPKLQTHSAHTPLHRGFSIFLFNKKGELLLQQRALSKKTWPGVWSNSCCGHPMLSETPEEAAKRRVRYELGIGGIDAIVVLPDFRYKAEKDGVVENEICPVLVGFTENGPAINPDEVNDVKWIDWGDFLNLVNEPGSGFSPWAIEEAGLLASNPQFKEIFQARTGG